MNKQFKNMKIRIHSPEHSRAVQEVLFKLGCLWEDDFNYLDAKALSVNDDNSVSYYYIVDGRFTALTHKEVTLEDLQAMLKQDTDTQAVCVPSTGVAYNPNIPVSDRFDALMSLMLESDCCITLCDEYYSVYDKWDNETKYHSYEDLIAGLAVIKKYKDLVDSN